MHFKTYSKMHFNIAPSKMHFKYAISMEGIRILFFFFYKKEKKTNLTLNKPETF